MSEDVVACSRGHELSRVVRDGIQRHGGREKQRWRCTLPDGSFHRFLGAMSRTRTVDGTCLECENHLHAHQGPQAPAEFEYLVREIAEALVLLGQGQTYTDVAKRVRARANIGKTNRWHDVVNGQTVADWMADFVPVVAARHAPTKWPAVIVLDSTSFYWTDPATGKSLMLFAILAAYGYDKEGKNGKLWKVNAGPSAGIDAWAEFLGSLDGKPESIVCDQDTSIKGGVEKHWGEWAAVHLVHHCEYHLGELARKRFESDKLEPRDPIRLLFRTALQSREGWDEFEAEVRSRPKLQNTNNWVERNCIWLRGQTQGRSRIPPIYANGAVEQPLREFRKDLRPRAFMFRNRGRLNHLLELMRLATLRVDNPADYALDIRTYLDENNGRPQRTYRQAYDALADSAGVMQLSSLWAPDAQIAMLEARMKRARKKLGTDTSITPKS